MKVFFDLTCMSTYCWALPKPKYEPFITHNRGALINLHCLGHCLECFVWVQHYHFCGSVVNPSTSTLETRVQARLVTEKPSQPWTQRRLDPGTCWRCLPNTNHLYSIMKLFSADRRNWWQNTLNSWLMWRVPSASFFNGSLVLHSPLHHPWVAIGLIPLRSLDYPLPSLSLGILVPASVSSPSAPWPSISSPQVFPQTAPRLLTLLPSSQTRRSPGPLRCGNPRSFVAFEEEFKWVFDHPVSGREASKRLIILHQGSRRTADFAIDGGSPQGVSVPSSCEQVWFPSPCALVQGFPGSRTAPWLPRGHAVGSLQALS